MFRGAILCGILLACALPGSSTAQQQPRPNVAATGNASAFYDRAGFTARTGEPGAVTLWKVAQDILGPDPGRGTMKPEATICIETPFGTICFEARAAELDEAKLKQITLGDVFADVFSRPRIKGTCFKVCHWGVCVIVCV